MWTPEEAQRYLRNNLDVLREYERNPNGMSPSVFAQRHYEAYGKAEGRKSGAELNPSAKQPGVVTNPVILNEEERNAKRAEMDARAEELRAKGRGGLTREESQWLSDYSKSTARVDAIKANGGYRPVTPEQQAAWAAKNPELAKTYDYLGYGRMQYKPGMSPGDIEAAQAAEQQSAQEAAYAQQRAERAYQNIGQLFGSGINALWDKEGNRFRSNGLPVGDLYRVPEGMTRSFLGGALEDIDKYDPEGKLNPFGDLDWRGKIQEYADWNKGGRNEPWYEAPEQKAAKAKYFAGLEANKLPKPRAE